MEIETFFVPADLIQLHYLNVKKTADDYRRTCARMQALIIIIITICSGDKDCFQVPAESELLPFRRMINSAVFFRTRSLSFPLPVAQICSFVLALSQACVIYAWKSKDQNNQL